MPNLIKKVSVNSTEYQIDYQNLAKRPGSALETEIYLEQQDLTINESDNNYYVYGGTELVEDVMIVGDTYIVTWDGTEYECVCFYNDGVHCIGNLRIMFDTEDAMMNEDAPFTMYTYIYVDEENDEETINFGIACTTSGTYNVKIEHATYTRKIPVNALPTLYSEETEMTIVGILNALSTASGLDETFTTIPVTQPDIAEETEG